MCFPEAPPTPTEVCAETIAMCMENGLGEITVTVGQGEYETDFGIWLVDADGEVDICRITCTAVDPSEHGATVEVEEGGGGGSGPGDMDGLY
ncbi:MAG: hypothetical protein P8P99_00290 [Maricaulis sp.]|nr:hypothetical protein [Maricaulis sp.]